MCVCPRDSDRKNVSIAAHQFPFYTKHTDQKPKTTFSKFVFITNIHVIKFFFSSFLRSFFLFLI